MATQPNARLFLSSSPLGNLDSHAEAFDRGEDEFQCVAYAPTWIANPTITEAATHRLEPDERIWRREFAAIPQASALAAFDADAIAAAFEHPNVASTRAEEVLIVDPSSGGADAFTFCTAQWCMPSRARFLTQRVYLGAGQWGTDYVRDAAGAPVPDPDFKPEGVRPFVRIDKVGGFDGGFWGSLSGEEIVLRLVSFCRERGIRYAFGDQRERLMLSAAFAAAGIRYVSIAYTAQSKPIAVERVRRWLRDRQLSLADHPKLRKELQTFDEKILPSGQISFAARGRLHDDYVALLLTTALADAGIEIDGAVFGLPLSPVRPRVYRDLRNLPPG